MRVFPLNKTNTPLCKRFTVFHLNSIIWKSESSQNLLCLGFFTSVKHNAVTHVTNTWRHKVKVNHGSTFWWFCIFILTLLCIVKSLVTKIKPVFYTLWPSVRQFSPGSQHISMFYKQFFCFVFVFTPAYWP